MCPTAERVFKPCESVESLKDPCDRQLSLSPLLFFDIDNVQVLRSVSDIAAVAADIAATGVAAPAPVAPG